ncbi:MAG: MCE family protein [Nocardioidaceae bacterium]|nr:MCE family protein [Nocardioidaceae bacterium]MCL2611845.1 MCE family protein [Nocardioidaceae bacterium]
MNRRRLLAALAAATTLLLGGCGLTNGVYDAPLPGGADLGSHPITLRAEFDDVLDLVPQSSVKVDDVAVGRVSTITLRPDGRGADVDLEVRGDLDLPQGTTARLEQTSLLGEKYVALQRPAVVPAGAAYLHDGSELGKPTDEAAAEVEQVLGALSLVLNGGGIGQFQEISRELQKVGRGRTQGIRNFVQQVRRFVTVLDDRRDSITEAIDGLGRLSKTLDGDKDEVAKALDGLSPGMRVLADQRPQLVGMLRSLNRLSKVTVATIGRAKNNIVGDLELLQPTLTELAKAGTDLPYALQIMLTYPFPDSVLGAIKGDYINAFMTTNFRTLPTGCGSQGCPWPQVAGRTARAGRSGSLPPGSTDPSPSLLPPTSTPAPGLPSPTVPGPSILPTDPSSGAASPSSPQSSSGASSGAPTPTGSASSSPSSTPSAAGSAGEEVH